MSYIIFIMSKSEDMGKLILVIPDVHGRLFWKSPVKRYLQQAERIVFLGDYLDPYNDEGTEYSPEDIVHNLQEIIDLKEKNMQKVVLLKGNHDQHYASEWFRDIAGGTRMDLQNWTKYHDFFCEYKDLFQIVHREDVGGRPYVFSHAGITQYWLHRVNTQVWHLPDEQLSLADRDILSRINLLDEDGIGQDMLGVVGSTRSWMGEETGGVLWADVDEHSMAVSSSTYALDKVFQVFGHSRLYGGHPDMIAWANGAMIDSQQCFVIDERRSEPIVSVREYES